MSADADHIANGEPAHTESATPGFWGDLFILTKARLITLVLVTTFIGFCMASRGSLNWLLLIHTFLGTAFVAASAGTLNQVLEHRIDRLMKRTRNRPLPAGRMKLSTAIFLGVSFALIGVFYLAIAVNWTSAILALATLAIYIFLYTPLKRFTWLCVTVGAVSGAIPPMVGWTAVRPNFHDAGNWILFGVLFIWQMPHFLSLAWVYRDDYANAGFVMLRRYDERGLHTSLESLFYTVALAVVTILPVSLHMVRPIYLYFAIVCNAWILYCAVRFVIDRSRANGRRLFFASIIYLPIILALMVAFKKW